MKAGPPEKSLLVTPKVQRLVSAIKFIRVYCVLGILPSDSEPSKRPQLSSQSKYSTLTVATSGTKALITALWAADAQMELCSSYTPEVRVVRVMTLVRVITSRASVL